MQYNSLTLTSRDSEASAPPDFPPEQPEADLAPGDEDEYGADELVEEEEELVETEAGPSEANGMNVEKDAEMGGVETAEVENGAEDEEVSDDGSVDIEGESEDEIEEEEAAEGDEMEVDTDKPEMATDSKPQEVLAH
jgi:histone chaperone ASF1